MSSTLMSRRAFAAAGTLALLSVRPQLLEGVDGLLRPLSNLKIGGVIKQQAHPIGSAPGHAAAYPMPNQETDIAGSSLLRGQPQRFDGV